MKPKQSNQWLVITAAFLSVPCLLLALIFYSPPRWLLVRNDSKVASDFLVVLGGVDSRVRYAARCYKEGIAPRILVTGYGDAFRNRDLLVRLGVPTEAIEVEALSHSTLENARFATPILRNAGARKATIITSLYHSSRAYATFRHEMPEVEFLSLPADDQFCKDAEARYYARLDILKRIWYFMRYGVPLHCW